MNIPKRICARFLNGLECYGLLLKEQVFFCEVVKADFRLKYVIEHNHVKTLCVEKRKYVKKTQSNIAGAFRTGDNFFSVFWVIYKASAYFLLPFLQMCPFISMTLVHLFKVKTSRPLTPVEVDPGESAQVVLTSKKVWETVITGLVVAIGDKLKYTSKKGK